MNGSTGTDGSLKPWTAENTLTGSLKTRLDRLFREPKYGRMSVGVELVEVGTGRHLYSLDSDRLHIPASAIKIFVSAITLLKAGAGKTIKTPVFYRGKIAKGVLNGDLCIKGMGDPSLTSKHLSAAARKLKTLGIKVVTGNLLYDTSLFDDESTRYPPNARHLYSPPSALSVNHNCVNLIIIDGPPPRLIPVPDTSYVKLEYRVRISTGHRANIPTMTYIKKPWGDFYTIRGTINQWNKRYKTMRLCVSRPGLFAATLFQEACKKEGISIRGNIFKTVSKVPGQILVEMTGDPLITSIYFLNAESNNVVAGNINKLLSTLSGSFPGTRAKGLKVVRDFCFNELGFVPGRFFIHDASGLSRKNRLSPNQFIRALTYFNKKLGADIFKILPEQGVHSHALYPKPPPGLQAFVKSGTLPTTGVNTLVGYIISKKTRQVFAFAILVNRKGKGRPMYSGTYTHPVLSAIFKSFK